jgi:hypothetical protein
MMLLRFPGRPINVSRKSIARLERVETLVRKQRRDGAAMLVMMGSATGDFETGLQP